LEDPLSCPGEYRGRAARGQKNPGKSPAIGPEDIWWILEGKDYPHLWWELGDEASL